MESVPFVVTCCVITVVLADSKFTRNTGFVFLIGRAKKRARKDIKGVYLLTINDDDGGVMVSRMGTSPAFYTTSLALSSNGFFMTFKELNVIIRSHFGTTRRIVDLLAVNCC